MRAPLPHCSTRQLRQLRRQRVGRSAPLRTQGGGRARIEIETGAGYAAHAAHAAHTHVAEPSRIGHARALSGALPPNVLEIGANIERLDKHPDASMFRQLEQETFEPWRPRRAP